jgi:siderophore synthetase component
MHKARYTVPPMPVISGDEYDLSNPRIRAIAVPRASVNLRGDFEELIEPLVNALFDGSTETALPNPNEYVLVPIHELQLPNIHHYFSNVIVLPPNISVPAKALTSLRSIVIEDVLPEHSLKLCLGMKVTSALRTITPFTTYFGPGFSKNVVPKLTVDHHVLQIERELASACYKHDDFNVAKHCSAVVREAFENTCAERGEQVVVCAALVEKCQNAESNKSLVEHVWGLNTDEEKEEFLER